MCTSPAALRGPNIGGCNIPGRKDEIVVDNNLSSDVYVSLETVYPPNTSRWQGFTLSFAYGAHTDIEDAGLGFHSPDFWPIQPATLRTIPI